MIPKQFTLYINQNKDSNETYPYFIDIQNELLSDLNSRVVIPLTSSQKLNNQIISKLCPVILIDGETFICLTHQMTTVPLSALCSPLQQIEIERDKLMSAMDFLISGI